jgi:hypothetical protein
MQFLAVPAVITATDNCDTDVTIAFNETTTPGSCAGNYTITRTWTATDDCNNTISHTQIITVEDTTAPVWAQAMPANVTVQCNAIPAVPAVITATDNCDTDVTIAFNETTTPGSCAGNYTITRTWTATDDCNNTISHTQIITVEDTTAPVWAQAMPTNVTVQMQCNSCRSCRNYQPPTNCDTDVTIAFNETTTPPVHAPEITPSPAHGQQPMIATTRSAIHKSLPWKIPPHPFGHRQCPRT